MTPEEWESACALVERDRAAARKFFYIACSALPYTGEEIERCICDMFPLPDAPRIARIVEAFGTKWKCDDHGNVSETSVDSDPNTKCEAVWLASGFTVTDAIIRADNFRRDADDYAIIASLKKQPYANTNTSLKGLL